MKAADLTGLVLDRLATMTGVDVVDGGVLKTPSRPYVAVFAGVGQRIQGRYCDTKTRLRWTYSVLVVNNSAEGARILADRVRGLLDEWRAGPEVYSVEDFTSDLIIDDDVEGEWRYSVTVYMVAHPPGRE